jgi:apoptosis-inducing factor 3
MSTGAADVYAAGDLAFFPYHGHATRIEHWDVAYDQGRVAARNMLGERVPYGSVPFFWTASFGKSLRYAGHCLKTDDLIVHGSLDGLADGGFVAYYVTGDDVTAVATLNKDPQAVAAMELLRLGALPSPAELRAAPGTDLAVLLKAAVAAGAGGGDASAAAGAGAAGGAGARSTGVATRSATKRAAAASAGGGASS